MSDWFEKNRIFLNLSPEQIIAITAYGEAASEGAEGLMAVINVIRNRTLKTSAYADKEILNATGSAWHAVVLKKWQFSMYNLDDPVRQTALKFAGDFDTYVVQNGTLSQAYDLATMAVNRTLDDNTGGATHYYANYIAAPSWAATMPFTGQIGVHLFFAEFPGLTATVIKAAETVSEPVASIIDSVSESVGSISDTAGEVVSGVADSVRKNPVTSVVIMGFAVGFLIEYLRRRF